MMQTGCCSYLPTTEKRIFVVTGHYGSGKTEYAVSLALRLAKEQRRKFPRLALADLDIVNPYFRSRERKELLEQAGVRVYSNVFDAEITAELPALSAAIRAPLEDPECLVILDVGGNDAGARVLHQFKKYLIPQETEMLLVLNANRPDTGTLEAMLEQTAAIEFETGLRIDSVINNTHMLMETTPADIFKGHQLCEAFCEQTGKRYWCDCYPEKLIAPEALTALGMRGIFMPLGLYMRESWLDK